MRELPREPDGLKHLVNVKVLRYLRALRAYAVRIRKELEAAKEKA